uniref:RNase H type-1 domain-containing protein n=1 Tax=Oryza glumipatula TaxID=40148 RepID=A0A0E0BBB9_9ORYZ
MTEYSRAPCRLGLFLTGPRGAKPSHFLRRLRRPTRSLRRRSSARRSGGRRSRAPSRSPPPSALLSVALSSRPPPPVLHRRPPSLRQLTLAGWPPSPSPAGFRIAFGTMEEGSDYYLVRKGEMVAVYKSSNDCQAQICSSVSGPAASAYKGNSWSREKEEYLSSRGLSNATYVINAAELREDLFGTLIPCTFQEITVSSSNQSALNHTGVLNNTRYQPGAQSVDLNYDAVGSGQASAEHYSQRINQGYSVRGQAFNRLESRPSSSSHFSPNNLDQSGTVDAQPLSKQYMVCLLHFDGASKGNPGKAGAGAVLMTEDGRVISRLREGLGIVTNNVAEYRGLILGLRYAIRHGFKKIIVYGDSQLVCYQVKGTWQTKNQNMMELCKEVRKLKENFVSFEINHVRREWNAEADRQANIAITLSSGVVSEERGDG